MQRRSARPASAAAGVVVAVCAVAALLCVAASPFTPTGVFPSRSASVISAAPQEPEIAAGPATSVTPAPLPASTASSAPTGLAVEAARPLHLAARRRGPRTIVARPLPGAAIIPPYRPPQPRGETPLPAGTLPLDTNP